MMKQITVTGLAVMAALGIAAPAMAMGPGGKISFETLDTDNNGEISKAELAQSASARFAAADGNADGVLDRDELLAAARARNAERVDNMLERMDADGDGAIALSEMPRRRPSGKMFDRMDADGSGGISQEEFAKVRDRMHRRGHKQN